MESKLLIIIDKLNKIEERLLAIENIIKCEINDEELDNEVILYQVKKIKNDTSPIPSPIPSPTNSPTNSPMPSS
jgi:hypothetical protein